MDLQLKYKKNIADEYGVDKKTLYNKLKACGLEIGRGLLSLEQQKTIYECLGYPPGIKEEDYIHVKIEEED